MTVRRGWHKSLDPEDLALWEKVKATVTPLRPAPKELRGTPIVLVEPASEAKAGDAAPVAPIVKLPVKAKHPSPVATTLERTLKRRLRSGAEAVGDRLDLHGLRQDEAHRRLIGFLARSQALGLRVVIVITGKGAEDPHAATDGGRGVLRRAVPQWLRLPECRPYVTGFDVADRAHGGSGALYVHIRRRRSQGSDS